MTTNERIARFIAFLICFVITWVVAHLGLQDVGINSFWLSGLAAWFITALIVKVDRILEHIERR